MLGPMSFGALAGAGGAAVPWYDGAAVAYQPIGAASLAESYVNLANPGTNDAAPGVAPTWDAVNGWTFNGTTQYLDTGFISAVDYSILVRFSGGGSGGAVTGFSGGVSVNWLRPDNGTSARWVYMNTVLDDVPDMTGGVMAIADKIAYRDGVSEGAITATAFSTSGRSWFIGGLNAGSLNSAWSGSVQAYAIYNGALTPAQVASVTAAMENL